MGLFLDAAMNWEKLLNTSYNIIVGRKKQSRIVNLVFRSVDFDHLSGIHYAGDIDFKLHRNEYRGDKLIPTLLSKKLDDSLIEKSVNWDKISERLLAIIDICKILETDFEIYWFSPNRLPFYSDISAAYFLYSEQLQNGVFLFIDRENGNYYCKSVFQKNIRDYRQNQTRFKILKKTKIVDGQEMVLYVHPSFKDET